MAAFARLKPPSVIDNFNDIDFQSEAEILCNFLRWDTLPRGSTENFKCALEKRARSFCVEEYIPTDNASPVLPWQLFYTGRPDSSGDDEQAEDVLEEVEPEKQDGDVEFKRLVIPHPRQMVNILRKVHEGEGGDHLSSEEMWEKIKHVYYWRLLRTSIDDFIKNCKTCKLNQQGPDDTSTPSVVDDDSTGSLELTFEEEDDDDDDDDNNDVDDEDDEEKLPNEYPELISQIYDYLKTRKYIHPRKSHLRYKEKLYRKARQYKLADSDRDAAAKAMGIVLPKKLYFLKAHERRMLREAKKGGPEGKWCKRLVIPLVEDQQKILKVKHIGAGKAHNSRNKMILTIGKQFYWKGMVKDITAYLENCTVCRSKREQETSLEQAEAKTERTKRITSKNGSLELTFEEEDDDDDDDDEDDDEDDEESFEKFKVPKEYHEQISVIYDFLKTHKYPPKSHPNFEHMLRRKAKQYMFADSDRDAAAEAMGIVLPKKLYYLKSHERRMLREAKKGGPEGKWCKRLVIPLVEDQQKILKVKHIGAGKAHIGRDKMKRSICKQFYWKGIIKDIIAYLKNCSVCRSKRKQKTSKAKKKRTKRITSKGRVTRSASKALNTVAGRKEFARKMKEVFDFLKDRSYPPNCTDIHKRTIRRKSKDFTLGQSAVEEWPEIDGNADTEERLYYLKKFRKVADQEENDVDDGEEKEEEVDDHKMPGEMLSRRLVVTTKEEQNLAIMKMHVNNKTGIHYPRSATENRLGKHYFWLDMRACVNDYIDDCECTLASPWKIVSKHPINPPKKATPVPEPSVEPSDPPVEPSDPPVDPVKSPVDPVESPAESPVEPSVESHVEPSVEPPVEPSVEPPVEPSVEPPPEPSVPPLEPPPLPEELANLPESLSSAAQISTEIEALILYQYLKWQRYPPECTPAFKRMIRRKSKCFMVQEEDGGIEDGEKSWGLFYTGVPINNSKSKRRRKVVKKEQTGGDGASSMDSIEGKENVEDGVSAWSMDSAEGEEMEESGETTNASTKNPRWSINSLGPSSRNRLFVFRRPDQMKILQRVHLRRGKRGEHAGRDGMVAILNRHFYWIGFREDAMLTITNCKRCQLKRNGGREYVHYLQEVRNGDHENEMNEAFEDQSQHELTPYVRSYLDDALRLESKWEAEEDAAKQANAADDFHSDGSMTGKDVSMDVQEGDRGGNEESRVPGDDSSEINGHQCDSCPRKFGHRDLLFRHKRAEHKERVTTSPCSFCGKRFNQDHELRDHLRSHTKEKPFECEYCKQRFGYRSGLARHRKGHFGLKPYTCQDCPQQFITKSDLNRHVRFWHEAKGNYPCDVCEKILETPVKLAMHKKKHKFRETFVCDICGKGLASAFSLKFHMHIHTGERRVLCELCGHKFKKKDELSKHMRMHLGIKPHECHLCQQRFALKSDLLDHLRSHEGASLYQCEICNKKFKNRRSKQRCMRRHNAKTANQQGFQCNTCDEVLGTLADFTQHMETHVVNQIPERHLEIMVGP